jgi:hypothetical protein
MSCRACGIACTPFAMRSGQMSAMSKCFKELVLPILSAIRPARRPFSLPRLTAACCYSATYVAAALPLPAQAELLLRAMRKWDEDGVPDPATTALGEVRHMQLAFYSSASVIDACCCSVAASCSHDAPISKCVTSSVIAVVSNHAGLHALSLPCFKICCNC